MSDNEMTGLRPVRALDRAISGGLGPGNLGVVLSRPGVGKTSFLIGVALDSLLLGRKVLHISTKEPVERVRAHYDQIFGALTERLRLENPAAAHLEMERNRHILVYNRDNFSLQKLEESVQFLREGADFDPDLLIMDGTPRFESTEDWEMEGIERLAAGWKAEVWTSAITHREGQEVDDRGVPAEVARFDGHLSVILSLEPRADHVRVKILKDHEKTEVADLHLELEPRTLLLRWR